MVFSSLTFLLLFLPVVLLLYYIRRDVTWRNWVLAVASLLFYAWGEPVIVLAMLLSVLINYLCGLGMASVDAKAGQPHAVVKKRLLLVAGIVSSVGMLAYYKYAGFLVETFSAVTGLAVSFHAPELPIGISFYTFQILTYTIDAYRGKVPVQRSFLKLLLYIACFPQLIAGPIVQYADIAESLDARTTSVADFTDGMRRFFLGLGKKVILANLCGQALEQCTLAGNGQALSFCGAWLAGILYAFQLYYDFSAYSDMAIGLGRVLGFTYRENFCYPYVSRGASEFWRRWHVSLGSFFRDYVYIPLGGNRRGRVRTVLNLLVVWALTGLWHGASWNFVLWGLYWFLLQQVDKALPERMVSRIPAVLRAVVTFLFAVIGWVLFYYTDLGAGLTHIAAMFGAGQGFADAACLAVLKQYALFFPVMVFCAMPVLPAIRRRTEGGRAAAALDVAGTVAAVLVAVASLAMLVGQSYNPFIYFRF